MTGTETKIRSKIAAVVLWGIVLVALGYGVVRTAVDAAALFVS
ncbi:MFS transporter small subunit [Nocardiopsis kunsanensis]|uniref:Uncharacterized protein n=1 Tax=Nocardiopsis kunsanensis TaxID=141693 RepID=A0A918XBN7_9ACTN|nr:hypothetical protein [Nocardiopsis kunsanensis]GHD24381.1 hypothetical protein GCM10007147_20330 [Nocardiopsis kunsanensis]